MAGFSPSLSIRFLSDPNKKCGLHVDTFGTLDSLAGAPLHTSSKDHKEGQSLGWLWEPAPSTSPYPVLYLPISSGRRRDILYVTLLEDAQSGIPQSSSGLVQLAESQRLFLFLKVFPFYNKRYFWVCL